MTPEMLSWMDHRRFFDNGESSRPGIDAFFRRTRPKLRTPCCGARPDTTWRPDWLAP